MKKIVILFYLFLVSFQILSQDIKSFDNMIFKKEAGYWYKVESENKKFLVDNKLITIKLSEDKTPSWDELNEVLNSSIRFEEIRRNKRGYIDLKVMDNADIFEAYSYLTKIPFISFVEINTIGKYNYTPDDDYYSVQWHLDKISADLAWDIVSGDSSIIIAIIDSGTEWNHEDLGLGSDVYQNIHLNDHEDDWTDPNNPLSGNNQDDDGNGHIDDWKGWVFFNNNNDSRGIMDHGTRVAGIAGAKTNNNTGVAGVAGGNNGKGVELMIIGVGDLAPSGGILDDAIDYAVDNGAHIIQMSLSIGTNQAVEAAIEDAYDNHNVLFVCASGNDNTPPAQVETVTYPATNENVIAVGATTSNDYKADFSFYGSLLEISAPGVDIFTTNMNNSYDITASGGNDDDGTSFAAPQVSATAALLWSFWPSYSNDNIRTILRNTADKVGGYNYYWSSASLGHSKELGYGRLNTYEAIKAINPYITGPSEVCESGATFTLHNRPPGTTVTWSRPKPLIYVSGQGTNNYTVAAASNDDRYMATIRATITGDCGQIIPEKGTWIGSPGLPVTTPDGDPPMEVIYGRSYLVRLFHPPGAEPSSGIWSTVGSITLTQGNTGGRIVFEVTGWDFGQWRVNTSNSCGTSDTYTGSVYMPMWKFNMYPNPADDYVEITAEKKEYDTKGIVSDTYEVKILNPTWLYSINNV